MGETAITERQQYWLDHILAAEAFNGTLVEYAKVEGLKVKDLYQWKTLLVRRGVMSGKVAQQQTFVVSVIDRHFHRENLETKLTV